MDIRHVIMSFQSDLSAASLVRSSDALLVPDHCVFDHVHDQKQCTSYRTWNDTALASCVNRGMLLRSFSMLQPCGIDRFNGVEFVCCPDRTTTAAKAEKTTAAPAVSSVKKPSHGPSDDDVFRAYMDRGGSSNRHSWNEHQYFVKAMEDLHRSQQDKMAKIMREWSTARQHVQGLKATDPRGAERLDKDITARFQKTYEALETENVEEKKQLTELHQQRVQSELNEKTSSALDRYMEAIDDNDDVMRIFRTLKRYVKVLQKDRHHTINRYKHLRETDPAEAEQLRVQMAEHLRKVDGQLTMALGMLDRVPTFKKKVEMQIHDYLDAYHSIDSSVEILLRSLHDNPPQPSSDSDDYEDDDYYDEYDEDENEDEYRADDGDDEKDTDADDDRYIYEDYLDSDDDSSEEEEDESILDSEVDRRVESKDVSDETSSSEQAETSEHKSMKTHEPSTHLVDDMDFMEAGNVEVAHGPFAAHIEESDISVRQPFIQKASDKGMNSFSGALPVGLVIGSLTVLVVIAVGILAVRRHRYRQSRMAVKVRLDPTASPEERHIAAMQMTGYENPTYKYFESSGSASA